MLVATARIHLRIEGAQSLKDKRQVLRSTLDRLRKLGVAAAEVDDYDLWNRATIGLAFVSNQAAYAQSVMRQALNLLEELPSAVVEGIETDISRFGEQ